MECTLGFTLRGNTDDEIRALAKHLNALTLGGVSQMHYRAAWRGARATRFAREADGMLVLSLDPDGRVGPTRKNRFIAGQRGRRPAGPEGWGEEEDKEAGKAGQPSIEAYMS